MFNVVWKFSATGIDFWKCCYYENQFLQLFICQVKRCQKLVDVCWQININNTKDVLYCNNKNTFENTV